MICRKSFSTGEICPDCMEKYLLGRVREQKEYARCSVCGKILLSEENICMKCRSERVIKSLDFVLPLLSYRLWAKNLMFQWKTMEKRALATLLARLIAEALSLQCPMQSYVLVPVPPRNGKIRKKGWDQIEDLCNCLKFRYGFKVEKFLLRNDRIQQKKLDRKQRISSSEKRYSFSRKLLRMNRENLPECVILIDDVMTTGITMESCALELKSAGIRKVGALTVFIVD